MFTEFNTTVTMHATVHSSPCNIMRLASAHTVNSAKTTCRKEGHHCESATERGKSGFGSCSVTNPLLSLTQVTECLCSSSPAVKRVTSIFSWQHHQAAALHLQLHSACPLLCLLLSSLLLSASAAQGKSSPSTSSLQILKPAWQLLKKKSQIHVQPRLLEPQAPLAENPIRSWARSPKRSRIMDIAKGSRLVYIKRKKKSSY